jgi:hypothetical protein
VGALEYGCSRRDKRREKTAFYKDRQLVCDYLTKTGWIFRFSYIKSFGKQQGFTKAFPGHGGKKRNESDNIDFAPRTKSSKRYRGKQCPKGKPE